MKGHSDEYCRLQHPKEEGIGASVAVKDKRNDKGERQEEEKWIEVTKAKSTKMNIQGINKNQQVVTAEDFQRLTQRTEQAKIPMMEQVIQKDSPMEVVPSLTPLALVITEEKSPQRGSTQLQIAFAKKNRGK